ncbi:MAG: Trk system potassium transporter TrkA [Desulfobacterales bacterium]|nr:Trk system potassium transporter TrkA [Desulfobacterales bacterium]
MKVIIVGAGQVGFNIASQLALENKDVLVLDRKADALRRVADSLDVQVIQGSGSSPDTLEEAGIKSADILLAVTDSDEHNLVTCLVASIIAPNVLKLARIRDAAFDGYHDLFREKPPHIDTVINPEIEVVKTILRMMQVPGAVDVADFADGRLKFVGVHLEENHRFAGTQLSELSLPEDEERPLIAAIERDNELIIPHGKDRLMPGDLVYYITASENLEQTLALFDKQVQPLSRALIVGGGRLGYRLARTLERQEGVSCKIIERDQNRCEYLAERLDRVVVLNGDGSDQNLLFEENVGAIDVVVTLTNDEETNILTSLLAKRMGTRKCITKISKFSYFPLMRTIGIEQIVSPRLSAIDSILQHVRKGKVLSAFSFKGEQAEVIEAVALETSDIVSKPLKNLKLPKGVLMVGILHGDEIIIPSGDTRVAPDDRVIIVARREAISKMEKIMSVKLGFF